MDDNKDMNGALSLRERLAGIPSAAVEALKRPQVWGFFLSLAVIAVVAMAFFYPDAPMGNELRDGLLLPRRPHGQRAAPARHAAGCCHRP